MKFIVKYIQGNTRREKEIDCADLNTCKTWANQWRVQQYRCGNPVDILEILDENRKVLSHGQTPSVPTLQMPVGWLEYDSKLNLHDENGFTGITCDLNNRMQAEKVAEILNKSI